MDRRNIVLSVVQDRYVSYFFFTDHLITELQKKKIILSIYFLSACIYTVIWRTQNRNGIIMLSCIGLFFTKLPLSPFLDLIRISTRFFSLFCRHESYDKHNNNESPMLLLFAVCICYYSWSVVKRKKTKKKEKK
jgi:hypothetical protein